MRHRMTNPRVRLTDVHVNGSVVVHAEEVLVRNVQTGGDLTIARRTETTTTTTVAAPSRVRMFFGQPIYRELDEGMLAGVCAGIAIRFGIAPMWIRAAFVGALVAGFGIPLAIYLVAMFVMPMRSRAEELAAEPGNRLLAALDRVDPRDDDSPEMREAIAEVEALTRN